MPSQLLRGSAAEATTHLSLVLNGTVPSNPIYASYTAEFTRIGEFALANSFASTYSNVTNAALATQVLTNLGVTAATIGAASYAAIATAVETAFAAYPTARGQVALNLARLLSGLEGDATYGAAATAWNNGAAAAFTYSSNAANTSSTTVSALLAPVSFTRVLSTNIDTIAIGSATSIDTVKGIVDGDADADTSKSTFSSGDSIVGNSNTVVELVVVEAGDADFTSVSNVNKINIVAGATGFVTFDAIDWMSVGSVNLIRGIDGLNIIVNNAEAGVGASVSAGVGGSIDINSTNDDSLFVDSDGESSVSVIDGKVNATVAPVSGDVTVTYTNGSTGDLAVSDVVVSVGSSAEFYGLVKTVVGDVSVGNLSVTVGTSADATMTLETTGTGDISAGTITASVAAGGYFYGNYSATKGSVTVGAQSVTIGKAASASLTFDSVTSGAVTAGNLTAAVGQSAQFDVDYLSDKGAITVGSIAITAAKNANVTLDVDSNGDSLNTTVGGISIVGASADSATITVEHNDKGGKVTVGDIAISGFTDSIFVGIYNYDTNSADAAASTTTVGDVTLAVPDSGTFTLSVTNENQGATGGALTVGDVWISMGKSAGLVSPSNYHLYIFNEADSAGATNAATGTTTIGQLDFDLAADADLNAAITVTAAAAAGKSALVGAVSVAGIDVTAGINADFNLDIHAYADGDNNGDSVGNISIGNVNLAGDDGAVMTLSISAFADDGKLGNTTVGNITAVGGVSSDLNFWNYFNADDDGTGTVVASVGNVTYGDIDMTVGKKGDVDLSLTVSASAGSVGTVTVGNVSLNVGESGSADFLFEVDATTKIAGFKMGDVQITAADNASVDSFEISLTNSEGGIGSITIGNIDVSVGVSANVTSLDLYVNASDTASGEASIGAITIGDITVAVAQSGSFTGEISLDGNSKVDLGALTIGNISLSAAKSANATYDMTLQALDDVGDINIAGVALSAVGAAAYAEFSMTLNALGGTDGETGKVSLGDVSLTANGAGAQAYFYVTAVSMAENAGFELGDVSIAVARNNALATLSLFNYEGSVTVGDINVTIGTGSGTAGVSVVISADDSDTSGNVADITIGDVTVSGGNGVADNLATFSTGSWLDLTAAVGDINIGTVDYSKYGAAATIDLSGFTTATGVVGSAYADTIIDGAGASTYTGGKGGDEFDFSAGLSGKTEATIDTVTDFDAAGGDLLLLGVVPTAPTYGEATYATFAAFVTGANAANKEVFVGQVGSNSFVAVDAGNDGTVDYIIKLTGVDLSEINLASFA